MVPNEHEPHEPHVIEPPSFDVTVDRGPKEPKEGNGGRNGGDRSGAKPKESKPGKDSLSPQTPSVGSNIVSRNSAIPGHPNQIEINNIIKEFEHEQLKAAREGRRADAKYFEKEKEKYRKMMAPIAVSKKPKAPKKERGADGGRNDGGTH